MIFYTHTECKHLWHYSGVNQFGDEIWECSLCKGRDIRRYSTEIDKVEGT
jgi:hypothetical protein